MRISDILRVKGDTVVTVTPESDVTQLLALLAEHKIGAVIVSADGARVDGIVSERDVVRALAARGAGVLGEPVTAIYTAQVRSVAPDAAVEEVERLMTEHRFRHVPVIENGRKLHREFHGTDQPHIMLTEFCVCGTNLAETEEEARKYQGKFVESNFYHYEFLGDHFKTVKGYDSYQQKAEIARKAGLEGAATGFMQAASWGTPDKILRGIEKRRELLGDFEMNVAFRFGGTPYEVSERGLKLFAKEVLPVLKSWGPARVAQAA